MRTHKIEGGVLMPHGKVVRFLQPGDAVVYRTEGGRLAYGFLHTDGKLRAHKESPSDARDRQREIDFYRAESMRAQRRREIARGVAAVLLTAAAAGIIAAVAISAVI